MKKILLIAAQCNLHLSASAQFIKGITALALMIILSQSVNAQLTGTLNVPGDYATLADAIVDLNTDGVGVGGVIINVVTGNPQTAPAGGYVIGGTGSLVLTTSSVTQPVTIQGNGNTITSFAPQTSGNLNDAIVKLIGADWVTIDSFTMVEDAANTTTAAGTNNMTEWGIALLYVTATDGAQNNTIQNNTIDLDRTYPNTFGIYSNSTHTASAVTVSASATGAAGGNDNLRVYDNNITDVNMGIVHVGPTAAVDQNLTTDIGGASLATGNTITNFGTTTTGLTVYANVSGTMINGILVRNSRNFNVSFNTVASSNGGTLVGTLNGIQIPASSNAPTGTLTQTINSNNISLRPGAVGIPINGINMPSGSVNATTTVSINNNDFNTFGHTVAGGTGAIIFIVQSSNPLSSSINGNTFTNISVNTTGSITFFSGAPTLISGASLSISSNQIVTGFTRTGAGSTTVWTTNASSVNGSSHAINNNNFSNITLTGASAFTGISNTDGATSSNGPTKSITGNTIGDITTGAGTVVPMSVNFSGASTSVSNNTIADITTSNSITALLLGGSNQATLTVSGNIIDPITSGGTVVIGISSAAPTAVISKNKIYDLIGTAAGSVVSGIAIVNTTTSSTVTVANNLIGNLTAPLATGSNAVIGINLTGSASSSNYNVSYNTVYVNNPTSGIGFGSSGISTLASATTTTSALNLRNNIIVNTSIQNGAGLTVAYRRSSGAAGTLANYAGTSNNNLFYAGTPSVTNLIYSDGVSSAQTLALYKAGVFTAGTIAPRDNASITENITGTFLSTSGSSPDFLHINPAIPTQVESAGTPIIGITDDFDGNIRNVSTPDIGADEFAGIALDVSAPVISYTLLANTSCTADRTFAATITDVSGVNNTPGTKPRLYFKKSGDMDTFAGNTSADNGWKYVEASNASSPFSFTTDYSLLQSPVVGGDVIQYFVVAQDLAGTPNVGINSGTFSTTPASVNLMAAQAPITGTINSYTIVSAGLIGTVTIGAAGTYTTLTAADGLFNAINTFGLSGNLLVQIIDTAITENGVTMLNDINYNACTPGPFTVTIKPTVVSTLSGSSTGAIIRLNAADNVIIDGSIGATPNTVCPQSAAIRDLTVTNTNAGTASVVIYIQSTGANGSNNNTVKNCNIIGSSPTTGTLLGIGSGGSTIGTAASAQNNSNQYVNNNISKCLFALVSFGPSAVTKNAGTVINQNIINTAAPNNVARGILAAFEDGIVISGNNIDNVSGLSTGNSWGISCGLQSTTTGTPASSEVTNATITNNTVGTVRPGSTYGVSGIAVASATSGTTLIANNMIADAMTNGTFSDMGAGIYVGGGTGSTTHVYYNTVTMPSTLTGGAYSNFAIAVSGSNPVVHIKNNILTSTGSNGANLNRAMGFAYSTFTNLTSDNNDLFASGTGSAVVQTGTLSNTGFTSYTLVTGVGSWNAASGKDANSKNVFPVFVGPSNLHLVTPDPVNFANLEGMGMVVSVTTDIDCQSRSGSTPDIGADEFTGAIPSCNTPTSVSIGSITTTSASVSFTCVSCTGSYIVEYGLAPGFTTPGTDAMAGSGGTVVLGGSSPIALSGLDDGTVYNVYVRQNCGMGSFSNNSVVTSFTTECNSISMYPFTETFEVASPTRNCWETNEYVVGALDWTYGEGPGDSGGTTDTAHSGDLNARFYEGDYGTDYVTKLVSPTLDLSSLVGSGAQVRFWYVNEQWFGDQDELRVYYKTSAGGAWTLITGATYTSDQPTWTEITLVLPSITSDYYIAFEATELYGRSVAIDDVVVEAVPACPSVVTSTFNAGAGTLRDIVACAAPGSTITFDAGLAGDTIVLTTGEISISKNLTFSGLGMLNLTISGNGTSRIFNLLASNTLVVEDLALINGYSATDGGAIYAAGNLILENVAFENNYEGVYEDPDDAKSMTVTSTATVVITGVGSNVLIKN